MGRLDGKVAIVTGAGKGIGKAIAFGFGKEGAKVVAVVGHHIDEAEAVAREIKKSGGEAMAVKADVSKISDIEAMVKKTTDKYGKVDALVNCAGTFKVSPFVQKTEADFDRDVTVNLKGTFFACQAVVKDMLARGIKGSIINVSSNLSVLGAPIGYSEYSAAKGGVNAFSRAIAAELAPQGIRVNVICPGLTLTEGVKELGPQVVKFLEGMAKTYPMGSMQMPEEYVGLAVWLVSDECPHTTAATFVVDGGVHAIQIMPPH